MLFGFTTIFLSLLVSSPFAVALSPSITSPDVFGISVVVLASVPAMVGPTGIGPIASGCEAQCTPLVPVFANVSAQDLDVSCRSDVVNQFNTCASCEFSALGYSQIAIQNITNQFNTQCATHQTSGAKRRFSAVAERRFSGVVRSSDPATVGPTGLGPIAAGCQAQCSPLVPVFADTSAQNVDVSCRSDVVNQFNTCASCEFAVLGFNQTAIQNTIDQFNTTCNALKNGGGRLTSGVGILGSLSVGIALLML
ncbi:hypothetical protein MVEN_00643300 [Mycena venus]|uniref:Uncharacterized protein n=1 Tax=Mycena venus TaxID=2733690 RepID=A0A8H7D8M9_9AGAR|nr:hypothetical protein MVEN_00643300 [Mycena venus]